MNLSGADIDKDGPFQPDDRQHLWGVLELLVVGEQEHYHLCYRKVA